MTLKTSTCALISAACLASGPAYAGAGANINACVSVTTAAFTRVFSVSVGGSGTHCMSATGNNTVITVDAAQVGIFCGSAGYVEEKGSSSGGDTCATDTSKWPISFQGKNTSSTTPYASSGSEIVSLESDMTHNAGRFVDNPPNDPNQLCNSQANCGNTSVTWSHGTQGPLYVIFKAQ